ncbi:DUF2326 domain-containing protein [Psychrobacter sp. UBA3480]|uniref:DUF2326 domain-containing protein n=1 Tax=Psychrobacter sp. UBA3480 TaxID=1947350 RepID=UPI0025FFB730|nr:DUF2326 domain-containing protein [Psychrobacter sp. UBA3480]
MKLSKIYSNQDKKFKPIFFNMGLNFIYGDVRYPENRKLDSHNLGKTTLARLLDFMLLAKRNNKSFLFANYDIFESFVFFLEVRLSENNYLTIRRSISDSSKISFFTHQEANRNYISKPDREWNHFDLPFDRAKAYLDSKLNLTAIKDWPYRKLISYLIRTQDDFRQVFQLSSQQRGKDADWKPYMADLLGFNGELARQRYQVSKQCDDIKREIKEHQDFDEKNASEALSKTDGRLLLRNQELMELEQFINGFNFNEIDKQTIEQLVADIDEQIIHLNMKEYSLKNSIYHIQQSFSEDNIKFDPKEVRQLFDEVSVLFSEQVNKDFEQLITFNRAITKERNSYLTQELIENQQELASTQEELKALNEERAKQLQFLQENELIGKFKESNNRIAKVQAHIINLTHQKQKIEKILELQKQQRTLRLLLDDIEDKMQNNVAEVNNSKDNTFSKIRLYFNEIISKVLNKRGEINVYLNKEGNFEFQAEYQDNSGVNTSESKGNTYQRLLCIAFDLAVTRAYFGRNFPTFIYIDGVFDSLDNRKKDLLLEVLREYSDIGIQIIATTINSQVQELTAPLTEDEIVLVLHDDGQTGRLFNMQTW